MARRLFAMLAVAGLLAAASPRNCRAAATSPTLLLSRVAAQAVLGKRTLTFEGLFDFENALQVAYPLHLVVFQGSRFVRYPVVGGAVTGDSALLADGVLALGELPALLSQGTPAPNGVRLVTLTPSGGVVTLPDDLVAGDATAVLFTVLPEENVLSNPVTFVLP
jgi:hypothetical protein